MNSQKIAGVAIVTLIIGAAAGFYFGAAKGMSQGFEAGKKAGIAEAADSANKEAAAQVNPFSGDAASTNPFADKNNPLDKVKTNPFE